ncbi:MAG: hypothetical protein AAF799_13825 [Myxococcota bacterium]
MSFDQLPNTEVLLRLQVPDSGRVTGIDAVTWNSEDDATAYNAVESSGSILPSSPTWTNHTLALTKADVSALDPDDHPWVMLHIQFSDGGNHWGGSHWALLQWTDEGFVLKLRSWGLDGVEICITTGSSQTVLPLALTVSQVTANPERVFALGDGGSRKRFRYDRQARNYLLMREFEDEFVWHRGRSDERVYPDLQANTTWNDGTIATAIHDLTRYGEDDARDRDRVMRTRLFPPNRRGPVSRENIAARRRWGQWYPVYRTSRSRDPVSTERNGVKRAWAYLQHVATLAPGRVVEMIVLSHAIVQGPSHFHSSNRPSHVSGFSGALPAFASGATFWVTGCNSHTKPPGGDEHLVQRQALTRVEGHVRAFIRLSTGVEQLYTHFGTLSRQPDSATLNEAQQLARSLFEEHPDNSGYQRWQIPGTTEDSLATQNATWSSRAGTQIRRISGFNTRATTILTWANADTPTDAQFTAAVTAAEWYAREITWDAVKALTLSGDTITNWIDRARRVLSASVHYVAAVAHMARANNRSDLRCLGGNPGMDGIHLGVTVTPVGDDGSTTTLNRMVISAYTRSHSYSRHNRPWLMAFYARFGLFPAMVLEYFNYQGLLDASGEVNATRTGVATLDRGFDYGTLHPTQ